VRAVLRVLRAQRVDGGGAFVGIAGQAGPPVAAEPCQVPPVLVPAVDEDADVGALLDVADSGELARVTGLRLLVDRRVENVADEGEADRDEPGAPVGGDRAERRGSCLFDEGALRPRQLGPAGIRCRQTPPPRCFESNGSIASIVGKSPLASARQPTRGVGRTPLHAQALRAILPLRWKHPRKGVGAEPFL
jgi:hypothetical protein